MAERDSTLAALREEDEALRLTGLNLHSLFERFPFAVQVYTPDGHPRYANPAHRMLWQQADDYRPPPDSVIFDTPRLAQMGRLADIRRGFAGESVTLPPALFTSSEMPTLAPETHRWVLTSLYPIHDKTGAIRAVVVMHLDVTEQKEAQQLLEQRVEDRTRELASLLDVSQSIASTLDLQSLIGLILDHLKIVADYDGCALMTVEGDDLWILDDRSGSARDRTNPEVVGLRIPMVQVGALWDMLSRQEAVIIADVQRDTELAETFRKVNRQLGIAETAATRHVRSWLAVPLVLSDRVIGLIGLSHNQPDYYTSRHAVLARAIANQAAVAIENARLFDHERRTARELASLVEVSHNLASVLELEPLLDVVLEQMTVVAEYDGASIVILEEDRLRTIRRRTTPRGDVAPEPRSDVSIGHGGFWWREVADRHAVIIGDVHGDEPLAHAYRAMVGVPWEQSRMRYVRSWMAVPLSHQDRVLGAVILAHGNPHVYTPRHADLAVAIATQAAAAIENARLYEQGQKLAALEERQRLARELHDSVSQVLFSIGLGARTARTLLDRGDPGRALPSVDYIASLAEMGTAEMRALLFALRPESLAQEGLCGAITKQTAALSARHRIAVETTLDSEPAVPLEVKEALYRIAQEAMHNTVKHARASRVTVRLTCDGAGVTLEVADNGVGFDPSGEFPGHLGLRSMRERVAPLGGSIVLDSAPGRGTAIRVTIPSHA